MAKQHKAVLKVNSVNFNTGYLKSLMLAVGLILLFTIPFYFILGINTAKNRYISHIPNMVKSNSGKIAATPAALSNQKATPSAIPVNSYSKGTPAPQNYSGYCLNVPVLVYHHIQPEATARQLGQTSLTVDNGIFAQQMAYLASNGYNAIWASDLVNALRNHTPLPPKSVVITMDDGYADNEIYALPVLEQYHLKANLMLASGLVDSNPDMLTWSEVEQMKNSGLYYFTNHTWSHWPVSEGPQSKINFEIDTAQSEIEQHTGQTVNIFTYPYGEFNNNAIQTLISRGYIGGFSTIPGTYQCESFIMTLHRTRIGNAPLSEYGL